MYNPKSLLADEFIDHQEILDTLAYADANKNNRELVESLLEKARPRWTNGQLHCTGLTHREASVLLACEDPELTQKMFTLAEEIKKAFYGNRIVIFAPLYLSNYCINGCVYCPYHSINRNIPRKKLNQEEVKRQVIALQDMGHKRLALEAGEDPFHNPIEYILECIRTIYSIKHKNGAIRRVNVNIAATTVENYRKLKEAGIGTYILFQETYHKESYLKLHPFGPKHDYNYHTEAMDRAMEGGIDDVGLGVLFGLVDYRFEILALMEHARHLEEDYGCGPHTVSFPRIEPAEGTPFSLPENIPHPVSDKDFMKIIAIIRIAMPYTGIIISTRERPEMRDQLVKYGVSQISAASETNPGGYDEDAGSPTGESAIPSSSKKKHSEAQPYEKTGTTGAQFTLGDHRSLDEVISMMIDGGYIPSFCTGCYRKGRVGADFMDLAKPGLIKEYCKPNAMFTFREYLEDYASPETKAKGLALLKQLTQTFTKEELKRKVEGNLCKIGEGERDLYF